MDDKEKTFFEKFADTVATVVGETAKAAVMPTRDEPAEAVAAKTNEQMYLGDAAVAPEAAVAQIVPKKRKVKRTAKSAKTAKAPAKKAAAKKTAKKSAPKTSAKAKKAAPKKSMKKGKKSKRG
jgi:hypothetical protein